MQSNQHFELELDDIKAGNPPGWGGYVAGVLWALQDAGHEVQGIDVMVNGRVPQGAGLSSSAALECAVAVAVSDLFGLDLLLGDRARATLAAVCVHAENVIAGAPTGGMDQSASLRCLAGHALLLDCRDSSVAQVPFDLTAYGLVMVVMDTRARHALVDGQYAQRRSDCEKAARQLDVSSLREVAVNSLDEGLGRIPDRRIRARARHVVTEIERVRQTAALLRAGRLPEVGSLFDASHASMRDDFEISCVELDVAVAAATAHGALGARMTGGGFGGSAIALVPAESTDEVIRGVRAEFDANNFVIPNCFTVSAGSPARRESWNQG
jgi:galactokinase